MKNLLILLLFTTLTSCGYIGETPSLSSVTAGNVQVSGNDIESTDTDGPINVDPNGDGAVNLVTHLPSVGRGSDEDVTMTFDIGAGANNPKIRYNATDNQLQGSDDGTTWYDLIAGAGTGDVVGPASSTDNAIARFDGTTGLLLQDSSVLISDAGQMTVSSANASTFNRSSSGTNTISSSIIVKQTSSVDMVDGFGSGISFSAEDDTSGNVLTGYMGFARAGADNTADFVVFPRTAGTANERFRVLSDGRVGIGSTNPGQLLELANSSSAGAIGLRLTNSEGNANITTDGAGMRLTTSGAGAYVFNTDNTADNDLRLNGGDLFMVNNNSTVRLLRAEQYGGASNGTGFTVFNIFRSRGGDATLDKLPLASGDIMGVLRFSGQNATAAGGEAIGAEIRSVTEEAYSGTNSGTQLQFWTTTPGTNNRSQKMTLAGNGLLLTDQPAITAKSAAATLTIAELQSRIIHYTGAAANLTFPTAADIESGFSSAVNNMSFDFSVINTGSGAATMVTNTGLTLIGSMVVTNGSSGTFRARRLSSSAYTIYRLN